MSSGILQLSTTKSYIETCADRAGLSVRYVDGLRSVQVDGRSISIPRMAGDVSTEVLNRVRSDVAAIVATLEHSDPVLQDAGYTYDGDDHQVSYLYDMIEAPRVQRIASKRYAGDRVSLTEGHATSIQALESALESLKAEGKVDPLVEAAAILSERSRTDFDPYASDNYSRLESIADPETLEYLKKAEEAGILNDIRGVTSSQDSLDVAKQLYSLLEEQEPPEREGDGESGDGESDDGSDSGSGGEGNEPSEASKAMRAIIGKQSESEEGDVVPDLEITYEPERGEFDPCGPDEFLIERDWHTRDTGHTAERRRVDITRDSVGKLGDTLRRLLQIKAHRFYRGGKKSGKIHNKNLYRAGLKGAEEYSQRVFRRKHQSDTLDTSVCLLVDYSGSMCGEKSIQAIAAAQALGSALGTVGIPCQIVGFTERGDKCRLPVFKEYDERYSAKVETGMINALETMGQNNDGDAVLWSYRGLVGRPTKRKVLVVLSDGMPATNRKGGAHEYTTRVVKTIEDEGVVEVAGIGIMDDSVEYIYSDSFTIHSPNQLTEALLKTIKRKIL